MLIVSNMNELQDLVKRAIESNLQFGLGLI